MNRKEVKVSEDEKAILKLVSEECKYITRDFDGTLYLYAEKPTKNLESEVWDYPYYDLNIHCFSAFCNLFQYIKWKDEEPTLISDLINS